MRHGSLFSGIGGFDLSDALNYTQQLGYTSLDDAYNCGAIQYLEFTVDEFYEVEGIWSIR